MKVYMSKYVPLKTKEIMNVEPQSHAKVNGKAMSLICTFVKGVYTIVKHLETNIIILLSVHAKVLTQMYLYVLKSNIPLLHCIVSGVYYTCIYVNVASDAAVVSNKRLGEVG